MPQTSFDKARALHEKKKPTYQDTESMVRKKVRGKVLYVNAVIQLRQSSATTNHVDAWTV